MSRESGISPAMADREKPHNFSQCDTGTIRSLFHAFTGKLMLKMIRPVLMFLVWATALHQAGHTRSQESICRLRSLLINELEIRLVETRPYKEEWIGSMYWRDQQVMEFVLGVFKAMALSIGRVGLSS